MKTFKQLIAEVAEPNNEDELNFKAKHAIELITFPPADEAAYSGGTKKSAPRRADYVKGEDEDVYEAKKLDPVGNANADIDNDGDTDDSDEYLHARRAAIAKTMKEAIEKKLDPVGKANADIDNDGDTDDSDEFLHARRAAIAKAMKKEAATSPYAIGMAAAMKAADDKPPLKKSTITKAHTIAKSIEKDDNLKEANSSKIISGLNAGDSVDVIVQNNLNKKGDNKDEILKVIRDYNWKKRMKKESANKIDEATPTKKEITTALQSIKAQPKEKVTLKKAPWNEKKEEVSLDEDATLDQIRAILTKKNDGTKVVKDKSGYFHIKTANSHKGPFHTMKDVLADLSESAVIVKAAAAHNDGKKKFNLDDEEFPVTIKPSTAKKIVKKTNLDEVSDKKLDDYRQRAFADQPAGDDGSDKHRKRKFGRDLAFAKQTGRAKVLATKESVELDENFKVGTVKLNDGSSVIIKEADAKLLNQLVNELADKNREAMMKAAMKDKKGFNEILGFAKEAL